jgi:CRISPR-associated protein (TIGR03984 family)
MTVSPTQVADLVAVRHASQVRASEALAWLAGAVADPSGIVGFGYGPDRALWFQVDAGGVAMASSGPADLTAIYELRVFDDQRELRWVQQGGGRGVAVVVAGRGTPLPEGSDVTDPRRPRPQTRTREILGGKLKAGRSAGWARLTSERWAGADLPIADMDAIRANSTGPARDDVRAVIRGVEYAVEDEHGNLTVVDTRLTGLDALPHSALQTSPATPALEAHHG